MKQIRTKILVLTLFLFSIFSIFSLTKVQAFKEGITYWDNDWFDPTLDSGLTQLSVDTYSSSSLNISSSLKAGVVLTLTLPSTLFLETTYDSATVNQAYLIANNLADKPVYFLEEFQLFTFNKNYYELNVEIKTTKANFYQQGFTAGYEAGLNLLNENLPAQFEAGKNYGIGIGRQQMYTFGAQFYGYSQANSRDYTFGLFDGQNIALDPILFNIYNNGLAQYDNAYNDNSGYNYTLGYNAGVLAGYADGLNADSNAAYQQGLIDGAQGNFMADLGSWMVPAIIIVLIGGGFIALSKRRE